MKRLLLILFFSILISNTSFATPYMDPPDMFSGVETLVLRAGTNGYPIDAQTLRGIGYYRESGGTMYDTLTTFGIGMFYTETFTGAGFSARVDWGGDIYRYRMLWRAELTGLPRNAVIVRARLFLRPASDGEWDPDFINQIAHPILTPCMGWQQIVTGNAVWGYRLLRDWDPNNVNWYRRFDHQDSTWHTPGIADSAGTYFCDECPTPDTYNILGALNRAGEDSVSHTTLGPYWEDIYLDIQSDNMYSGYGDKGLLNADYVYEPISITTIGRAASTMGTASSLRAWLALDVTRAVSMWHYGVWANYGLLLDTNFDEEGRIWMFWSEQVEEYSPKLVIEYLHAASPVGAGGKKKISPTKGFDRGVTP